MSDCYIARSQRIAARRLGDETIVMSAADSTLFTLNRVATAIWEAADGKTPLRQIVDEKVCAEFDITRDEALRDAEAFIAKLSPHHIIFVADHAFDPVQAQPTSPGPVRP